MHRAAGPLILALAGLGPACGLFSASETGLDSPSSDSFVADSDATAETGTTEPDDPGVPLAFVGDPPRNLLILSVDTTRRDRLGSYGGGSDATPFLDGIAATGVALDDHVSCSNWTLASIICALTGKSDLENGVVPHISGETAATPIPEDITLLAEVLQAAGYGTWLVSSNTFLSETYNTDQGYTDSRWLPALDASLVRSSAETSVADLVAAGPEKWLYHLHLIDPHRPYMPPDPYHDAYEALGDDPLELDTATGLRALESGWTAMTADEQAAALAFVEALYLGEIQHMDHQLSLFWDFLDAQGLLDDTLVMFWSDHGEQLFEHGELGHGNQLLAGENNAFAFFWADNLVPGSWPGPTTHEDLMPTVLDALGVAGPADMSGVVAGHAAADRARYGLVWPTDGPIRHSVIQDGWRMVYDWDGNKGLFDRATDPLELTDLYDVTDPRVRELWSLLQPQVDQVVPFIENQSPADAGP